MPLGARIAAAGLPDRAVFLGGRAVSGRPMIRALSPEATQADPRFRGGDSDFQSRESEKGNARVALYSPHTSLK